MSVAVDNLGTVQQQVDAFQTALAAHDTAAVAAMVDRYETTMQQITSLIASIQDQIAAAVEAGVEPSPYWATKLGLLDELGAQVDAALTDYLAFTQAQINAAAAAAGTTGIDAGLALINAQGPAGVAFAVFPHGALANIVASTQGAVGDLLAGLSASGAADAVDALQAGLALGKNPNVIAKMLQEALGGPLHKSVTIARTEIIRAYREATHSTLTANGDVLEGWLWHAALDRRTCPVCFAMHGSRHKIQERMGSHPNCRCVQVPLTKTWKELGFPGVQETRADFPDGQTVFADLDPATQKAILGPSKFAAYTAGDLSLADLVKRTQHPVWGAGLAEASLADALG